MKATNAMIEYILDCRFDYQYSTGNDNRIIRSALKLAKLILFCKIIIIVIPIYLGLRENHRLHSPKQKPDNISAVPSVTNKYFHQKI